MRYRGVYLRSSVNLFQSCFNFQYSSPRLLQIYTPGQVSNRGAVACASAYMGDLIAAGIIPPKAACLAVDPTKLQRARDKLLGEANSLGVEEIEKKKPRCLMFDARIDPTNVRHYDSETNKYYARVEKEDHYSVTDEDGLYIIYFTEPGKNLTEKEEDDEEFDVNVEVEAEETAEAEVPADEDTNDKVPDQAYLSDVQKELEKKPAEVVARLLVEKIRELGLENTLELLGGDSTSSNTGWRGGVIAWVERIIGRKFHWLICLVHTNELGLRCLIQKTDGKTDSKKGFSGPLGKLLKLVPQMKHNPSFKPISVGPDLISLPPEIVKSLSTDANLAYLRCQAVRSGHLPRDVALRKTGEIVHCRWLTTGSTFLDMWTREHGLEGELLIRLENIVIYLVSDYFPMHFLIKVKHSWLDGPRHVLNELSLFRLQAPSVQELLEATVRRSAWYSHSESVLQTMICSDDKDERGFAVDMILKIRGRKTEGDLRPRYRKHPELKLDATNLKDMISWKRAKEPVLTCKLSKQELLDFKVTPMMVNYYPVHSQGMERSVQELSHASLAVFGFERREGWMRARAANRNLMPEFRTKKDLVNPYQ